MLQRYAENLAYMAKFLFSTAQISEEESIRKTTETDIYGFRKTLVALTNSAKIISFSSMDGSILWTSHYFKNSPLKILLRHNYLSELEITETQVVSCFSDSLQFMSSLTGQIIYTQPLKIKASQFIVTTIKQAKSQLILAIGKDEQGVSRVEAYPQESLPK